VQCRKLKLRPRTVMRSIVNVAPMSLNDLEQRVYEAIEERRDELVELTSRLIGFDTTAREVGEPPREEAALQEYLSSRLREAGAEVDVWEPDGDAMQGKPLVPPGLDFDGRPQMIASWPGRHGGRSLVFNGHIDVVSGEPSQAWRTDPFTAEARDGRIYGRGSCDMKGGIAAMSLAAETLASLGVQLDGQLIVATNTDEESSGAGGSALVAHGLHADAGIVTEPTGFETWVACRGSEYCQIEVAGRPGHAEVLQPDWHHGGAVNAIEKASVLLEAIASLRSQWGRRKGIDHPYLSPPSLVPTMATSGEWAVTYPASYLLTVAIMYVPAQADERGWGSAVQAEVEEWIARETARDDWLAEHPPKIKWFPTSVMPVEISTSEPIVTTVTRATEDIGAPGRLSGLDSWYDGATLTHLAGIPSIGFGPPGFDLDGATVAHTIDEFVPIDGLVKCSQALAVAAVRFCGVTQP
jgi:acetylornithine deacetylase